MNRYMHMMPLGTMKSNENNPVPHNWSDALIQFRCGIRKETIPRFQAYVLKMDHIPEP